MQRFGAPEAASGSTPRVRACITLNQLRKRRKGQGLRVLPVSGPSQPMTPGCGRPYELNWCCDKCHHANRRRMLSLLAKTVEMEPLASDHHKAEIAPVDRQTHDQVARS